MYVFYNDCVHYEYVLNCSCSPDTQQSVCFRAFGLLALPNLSGGLTAPLWAQTGFVGERSSNARKTIIKMQCAVEIRETRSTEDFCGVFSGIT